MLTLIMLLLLTSHTVTAHPADPASSAHLDHAVTAHLVDHVVSVNALNVSHAVLVRRSVSARQLDVASQHPGVNSRLTQ